MKKPVKIGVVGQTDGWHAVRVCCLANGARSAAREILATAPIEAFADRDPDLRDVAVEAVMDLRGPDATRRAAQAFGVSGICESPEEVAKLSDAVCLLTNDINLEHQRYAEFFLERGKPLYVDKPFAMSEERALAILDAARRVRVPLIAGSARAWDAAFNTAIASLEETVGKPLSGFAFANWQGESMIYLGSHAIELVMRALGHDVVTVHETGSWQRRNLKLGFSSGAVATLDLLRGGPHGVHVFMCGDRGSVALPKPTAAFGPVLKRLTRMVSTGEQPQSSSDILQVVRVYLAAERSLAQASVVELPPLGERLPL